MIAVVKTSLLFAALFSAGVISERIVWVIGILAGQHGGNIGLVIVIAVDQIKIVKHAAATGGRQVILTHFEGDLIIKAAFFTDLKIKK